MKAMLIAMVLKFVDVKGLLKGLLGDILFDQVIYKKIDELVLASDNKLDDGLAVIIKPQLKSAVMLYADQEVDKLMEKVQPLELPPA